MQTPDICIYHDPCTDGFTAAWTVWKRFGDTVKFVGCKYGDKPPDVVGQHVLIVDFSFDAPVLREMALHAASITILDHHKTAKHALELFIDAKIVDGEFDMNRSGARIAWDWAFPTDDVPRLVAHVEDRDLWRYALPCTREIFAYLSSVRMDFTIWDKLADAMEDDEQYFHMVDLGSAILCKHDLDVENLIATTQTWMNIGGHHVPVANVNYQFASDLANKLALLDEAPFGATYFDDKDGFRNFSLRSVDAKLDVSEIAKNYGGGGHRNASGFKIPVRDIFARIERGESA